MMRMHFTIPVTSSPSRETEHCITFAIHVRSIFDSGLTERENPSSFVYPGFGGLFLITKMIAISV